MGSLFLQPLFWPKPLGMEPTDFQRDLIAFLRQESMSVPGRGREVSIVDELFIFLLLFR